VELSDLRRDFGKISMEANSLPENPIELFNQWLKQASDKSIAEFNAMVLSTVNAKGKPSSRIVLLKEILEDGSLIFFTNYKSQKGDEIGVNPNVSLNFFWKELERQVRIEGEVKRTSREKSEAYFKSRPMESNLSAIVSPQSKAIDSLEKLKKQANEFDKNKVKLPDYWGGYTVHPNYYEFWQGGKKRMHDRISYRIIRNIWKRARLAP